MSDTRHAVTETRARLMMERRCTHMELPIDFCEWCARALMEFEASVRADERARVARSSAPTPQEGTHG